MLGDGESGLWRKDEFGGRFDWLDADGKEHGGATTFASIPYLEEGEGWGS